MLAAWPHAQECESGVLVWPRGRMHKNVKACVLTWPRGRMHKNVKACARVAAWLHALECESGVLLRPRGLFSASSQTVIVGTGPKLNL